MQFIGIDNPFGATAFEPAAIPVQSRTLYYKGLRLNKMPEPVRTPAPRPLSFHLKNFLLAD